MADVEKVKKGLECCNNHDCDNCPYEEQRECYDDNLFDQISDEALSVINQQQAEIERLKAEQPKIIRCKDCKYGVKHELDLSNMYECGYPFTIVQEGHFGDFFCAMAEPKEGEKK